MAYNYEVEYKKTYPALENGFAADTLTTYLQKFQDAKVTADQAPGLNTDDLKDILKEVTGTAEACPPFGDVLKMKEILADPGDFPHQNPVDAMQRLDAYEAIVGIFITVSAFSEAAAVLPEDLPHDLRPTEVFRLYLFVYVGVIQTSAVFLYTLQRYYALKMKISKQDDDAQRSSPAQHGSYEEIDEDHLPSAIFPTHATLLKKMSDKPGFLPSLNKKINDSEWRRAQRTKSFLANSVMRNTRQWMMNLALFGYPLYAIASLFTVFEGVWIDNNTSNHQIGVDGTETAEKVLFWITFVFSVVVLFFGWIITERTATYKMFRLDNLAIEATLKRDRTGADGKVVFRDPESLEIVSVEQKKMWTLSWLVGCFGIHPEPVPGNRDMEDIYRSPDEDFAEPDF